MRYLPLIALAAALFAPSHCMAQSACPWINSATAAGVLEAEVQTSVQGAAETCTFKGVKESGPRSLVVETRHIGDRRKTFAKAESRCTSAATPVKGLGNEAFECVADHGRSHGMMMIGRVREKLFVVSVVMPRYRDQGTLGASLEDKLAIAAGQVVGNLF